MEVRPQLKQAGEKVYEVAKGRLEEIERRRPINKILGSLIALSLVQASFVAVDKVGAELENDLRARFKSSGAKANSSPHNISSAVLMLDKAPMIETTSPTSKLSKIESKRADQERAREAVKQVKLTPQGYVNFTKSINTSYLAYAQTFPEFNPNKVPIRQGKSKVFVWHYTTFYLNQNGLAKKPQGDMDVDRFVKSLARRGDDNTPPNRHCCGVNWLIDRHGTTHQLAPLNAKLRHNPPYDSVNTGVEIESVTQGDITTKQYESLGYLTAFALNGQGLLYKEPLDDIAKGHGEMRDSWNKRNPYNTYDQRNDFDADISGLMRSKIQDLLDIMPKLSPTPSIIK